jgi:hypothetical protein
MMGRDLESIALTLVAEGTRDPGGRRDHPHVDEAFDCRSLVRWPAG